MEEGLSRNGVFSGRGIFGRISAPFRTKITFISRRITSAANPHFHRTHSVDEKSAISGRHVTNKSFCALTFYLGLFLNWRNALNNRSEKGMSD
jgi:hypothetical protein